MRWCALALVLLFALPASAREAVSPDDAIRFVGKQTRVCGVVASAKYASESNGEPTFLNLGQPYPRHVFTALVWGSDRHRFEPPPESLEGRNVCVSGVVETYKGKAQIIVERPEQIEARTE